MTPSNDLISLVYVSAATVPFSTQDLNDLLATARKNNSTMAISGMLLFRQGNFLQVLEGEPASVLTLFERISKDRRHGKITVLSKDLITQKDFPDWSMGFNDLETAASRPAGFTPFLESSLTLADFASYPGRAKKLLLLFKENKLLARGASAS